MATKKSSAAKKAKAKSGASSSKKAPRKKTARKTSAGKKKPASAAKKRTATRKKQTKKAPARKTTGTARKSAAGKKTASRKTKKPTQSAAAAKSAKAPKKTSARKKKLFTAAEMRHFRKRLLDLRDRIVDEISFLAGDNLNRSQRESSGDLSSYSIHQADQGTDNFDREFALNLVSSEQDTLYEIDEALRRMDQGTYGICEISGEPIEKERLEVIPYARNSAKAQSEIEKGRSRYRPFGGTISRV